MWVQISLLSHIWTLMTNSATSSWNTWRPFWKGLWHPWRLHIDTFTKPFLFLCAKAEICSSYLFQTILVAFGPSLPRDCNCNNIISLSSKEKNNFSARNTPVACPIQYVFNFNSLTAESASDQNVILMSSCSSTCWLVVLL